MPSSSEKNKQDEVAGRNSLTPTISIESYHYEHPYFALSDKEKKAFVEAHSGSDKEKK